MALHDSFTLLPSTETVSLLISEMTGLPNKVLHIYYTVNYFL